MRRNDPLRGAAFYLALFLTGGSYFIGAKLGLKLAFQHPSATPVWPPTGIALACLVLYGYRLWPAIFVAAFLANLTTAGSVATSIGIAAGNTLEAVLGTFLVARFAAGRDSFDRPGHIFRWTLLAAAVAPLVSATLGVLSLT
ncbi:MAG TPA: MASE1 domain-containing protein, partial [Planctomycetota bacterium]|nr:MASE1 domain-containing protein [Planctomycetota bacterium]